MVPSLIPPATVCPPSLFPKVLGIAMNWKMASPGLAVTIYWTADSAIVKVCLVSWLSIREIETGLMSVPLTKAALASMRGLEKSRASTETPSRLFLKNALTAVTLDSMSFFSMSFLVGSSREAWSWGLMDMVASM